LSRHAVIIGAGVAGLATSARLAAKGHTVSVYEKKSTAGGKLGKLQTNGYTWDTGPSLFTQPYLLDELFTDCGKQLSNYLQYQPLPINTHYFYEDGTILIAHKDRQLLGEEMERKLGIKPDNLFKFLDEVKDMYLNIGTIFLNEPIHQFSTWTTKRIPLALRSLRPAYLLTNMHNYHVQKLQHPKLVQLFDRFATYNGSNPYQSPAMLCMIAHLEMNEGAYYPAGGMISIAEALYRLCLDMGVQFHFNTAVEKIIVNDNAATGIKTNTEIVPADIVVSNSDIYYTYQNLLGDTKKGAQIKKQERSSSAVIFYWGVRKTFSQLGLHNIFFSANYKEEFEAIFYTHDVYNDPTIYVNITAKMEPAHAPEGCENWFVLVNTPGAEYVPDDKVAAIRIAVISKLSKMLDENIEQYIDTEQVLTPSGIQHNTGSYLGALYGTASNHKMAAFLRHSNVSSQYKNLFFAGGTVHPGGGIPLCLRSAKLVSDAVTAKG